MSNKPTSLILFKRRAPDNSETEHLISTIDNEIARRSDLHARIIAHNKIVREAKLEAEAKSKAYKSTRIINRTVINNNVNMF